MKRTSAILVLLLGVFAVALQAADKPPAMSGRLQAVLEKAITNEREAIAKYEAFAQKAEEEGYPGAATLFRAAARAEGIHAERFIDALKERSIAIPEPPTSTPQVGTTGENLRSSSSAESSERDGIYKDALNAAKDAKDAELSLYFDQTRDTEVEHANLMNAAARQLESLKQPKTYYVCPHCGYTSDLDLPFCVLCRNQKHPTEVD